MKKPINVYAQSLATGKYKPRIIVDKRRKIRDKLAKKQLKG